MRTLQGAQGSGQIQNAHPINRGYEAIEKRLGTLGAKIRREPV